MIFSHNRLRWYLSNIMFKFNSQRHRALLYLKLKGITFKTALSFSLKFCTTTSDSHSFTVSYLINNVGFSPQTALKASKRLRFKTSQKPDSVLTVFRNHGFSDSHLQGIITKEPWLLSCNPHKRVLPKFEFLLSKGVSTSDIVSIVTKSPRLLAPSLENQIIPTYELLHRFLQSDKETFACMLRYTLSLCSSCMTHNIKLLTDYGVSDSNIAVLLRRWPSILCSSSTHLLKEVQELKELGFNPSKYVFSIALLAKLTVRKSRWDEKVDVFKKWGWSDETILEAFRRQPNCMLISADKIRAVMGFWVNQLGWDALELVKGPDLFGLHLEKRIIPRAFVLQYLLAKGLIRKNASLIQPFRISEEIFLQKFVKCFKEEEMSQLLKLYQEKMNLQENRGDGCIQQSTNP